MEYEDEVGGVLRKERWNKKAREVEKEKVNACEKESWDNEKNVEQEIKRWQGIEEKKLNIAYWKKRKEEEKKGSKDDEEEN